jgi:hypothetical protein
MFVSHVHTNVSHATPTLTVSTALKEELPHQPVHVQKVSTKTPSENVLTVQSNVKLARSQLMPVLTVLETELTCHTALVQVDSMTIVSQKTVQTVPKDVQLALLAMSVPNVDPTEAPFQLVIVTLDTSKFAPMPAMLVT